MSQTYNDRARQFIAGLNGAEFTTADIKRMLDGYHNSTSLVQFLLASGEIERTSAHLGHGRRCTYRATAKLKTAQREAREPIAKPPRVRMHELYPLSQQEQLRHHCALQLQAALDAITRRNRAEACHA